MKKTALILSFAIALIVQMTPKPAQAISSSTSHAGAIIMGVLMAMAGVLTPEAEELLSPEGSGTSLGGGRKRTSLPEGFQNKTDLQKEFAYLNNQLQTADLVEQTATGSFHVWVPMSQAEMNGLTTSSELAQQAAF